jgi:hypothetical protein
MTPQKVFTRRRPPSYSEKVDALWTPRHNQPGALGGFSVAMAYDCSQRSHWLDIVQMRSSAHSYGTNRFSETPGWPF